jgi:hypothetical protein
VGRAHPLPYQGQRLPVRLAGVALAEVGRERRKKP